MGCKSSDCSPYYLECMKRKSFLGHKCAYLPSVTHYKYDRHPLVLCYHEKDTTSDQYWCEICESKIDVKAWFYTCDSCRVIVHVSCLLGKEICMKPMYFHLYGNEVLIIRNNFNPRKNCYDCDHRCVEPFLLEVRGLYACSFDCLKSSTFSFMY